MTPLIINLLLHCYAISDEVPNRGAPAVEDGLKLLLGEELICHNKESGSGFSATARGEAHIRQILELSLPVRAWVNEDLKVLKTY